jgi:hypothetical protein
VTAFQPVVHLKPVGQVFHLLLGFAAFFLALAFF